MLTKSCPGAVADVIEDDDPRVIAALEEYLEECQQGKRPRRSLFLRRYPEISRQLEECLEGLQYLQGTAHHFELSTAEDTWPYLAQGGELGTGRQLGDYLLIRELGRGGMGVVYEAVQASLGRRVAVKLLPSSAAMDPRQVQRFQVEVQAAAQLHHPHIVPVYAVGCESGIHYFAMQFIAGRSLAKVIADRVTLPELGDSPPSRPSSGLPGPISSASGLSGQSRHETAFYRQAALVGIQAAEALAHAHRQGVVHRDIKPSNLLLDDRGQVWVADFGLAQLQGDTGVTVTGDIVGTLKYMSPEQAMAQRGVVDHRTDQYSLGATIYELIAGRPAFEGADLQTLVQQITRDEPAPPTRHNREIPRDLETIILKAMSRDPANRYPTMEELADDLGRFVEDRPILARRPSLIEESARWVRRHRAIVISAAIVLVLALLCLSISLVVIWRAMNRTAEVAQARTLDLQRAEMNLQLASRALDLYLNTAESWYPRDPLGTESEKERLRSALAFYEQIASQSVADAGLQRRTVSAYARVGDIHTALGDIQSAEHAYRRALTVMEQLRSKDPGGDQDMIAQAGTLEKFAGLFHKLRHYGPAEWSLGESVRLLDEVARRRPQNPAARLALAHALNQDAALKGETGRTAAALEEIARAVELLQELSRRANGPERIASSAIAKELASVHMNMGKWLHLETRLDEAEESYRSALELLEDLSSDAPTAIDSVESLATCQAMLGELLRSTHRVEPAERLFQRAIGRLERLAADYPRIPRYREHAARVYRMLSTLYLATDRPEESAEACDRAIAHDPKLRSRHHVQLNNLAWYLVTAPVPTARNPIRGLELAKRAVAMAPCNWESWNTLGVAHYRNAAWDEAIHAFHAAMDNKPGENAFDGFFLAMSHWHLGQADEARAWFQRAEEWRLRNLPANVELLRFRAEAEQLIGALANVVRVEAPALPGSILEALNDPSFRLPRALCEAQQGQCSNPPEADEERKVSDVAIFELEDHVLFFIDLT